MDKGKIAAEGSPAELIRQYSTREVLELRFPPDEHQPFLPALDGLASRLETLPDRVLLYTDDGDAALSEAHRRGVTPLSALVRRSSLEDVFLRLTGRSLVD
jgi:lipooligosaccharide transport system ATP-binding protein